MNRYRVIALALALCLLLPCLRAASAERTGEKEYALLYSMTGYAANGTKRVFLRQLTDAPAASPEGWRLYRLGGADEVSVLRAECEGLLDGAYLNWVLGKGGEAVLEGTFHREPETFQVTVLSGDFSAVSTEGAYVAAGRLDNGETLVSKPFVIAAAPLSGELLPALSVYGAQARHAKQTYFGGFYDCNSRFGEAYSHGTYLSGLSNYALYGGLEQETLEQVRWAAQVAFDYLMGIYDQKTGEVRYSAPERPGDKALNGGVHNSIEAVCGLAAYMDAFAASDPQRVTEKNRERIRMTVAYIDTNLGANNNTYVSEWKTSVLCHLYRAFGHEEDLEAARRSAEITLEKFDWARSARGRVVSPFEGLWLLSGLDETFADTPVMREKLALWQDDLTMILENSAYAFPPFNGAWEVMHRMSLSSYFSAHGIMWCLNQNVLGMALDACFLWALTGNRGFEKMAAGALHYVTGLNFGFAPDMCTARTSVNEPVTCASFAANMYGGVIPWDLWQFGMRNEQWASIVNGYTFEADDYLYTNEDWMHGETFIRMDGAMLYAGSLYEMLVNQANP